MFSMFRFLLFFIFFIVIIIVDSTDSNSPPVLWQNLSNFMQFWSKEFSNQNKPILKQLLNYSDVSQNCRKSLISTLDGVSKFDDWAIQMINSWGNFPPRGLFEGSLTDFGSYDQCLSVSNNEIIGSAQYCSISFVPIIPRPMPRQHNLYHQIANLLSPEVYRNKSNALIKIANESSIFYWVSLRTAVCTPSKCSQDEIQEISKKVSEKFGLSLKSVKCETKSNSSLNEIQLFAICFILLFVILCLSATICDLNLHFEKKSKVFTFIRLFSVPKVLNRLNAPTTSKDLSCIHGIRVLSILWIIYGHSIQWTRSFHGKELLTDLISQPFLNGEYGVVTFILISGILTTYISLSMTKGNLKHFRLSCYITIRAIRLVPQLMIVILLTFLLPLLGSGPIWDEVVGTNVRKCEQNWWLNLFLVQNLYKTEQMCAIHTWFIALDYQFHLLAALLILVFLYNRKYGLFANIFSILVFLVISVVMVYVYELPPALINTGRTEYFEKYYSNTFHKKPISYGAVYFVGTLVGYLIYQKRTQSIRKPTLVWALILVAFCFPLWDKVYWNYGRSYTPLVSTVWYNTNQMIWTVCTSAMIWLCVSGNGKVINSFLSHKMFLPLSRITYSVYLCHAWLIWLYIGSRKHLIEASMYNALVNFIHICFMSYIIGFVFYVLFESPILEFQRCLLESMTRKCNNNNNNIEVEVKPNIKSIA